MKRRGRRSSHPGKGRDRISAMVSRLRRVEEQTGAESAYLTQLIENRTPVIVSLVTGEEFSGWIEYCDKHFIRLTRDRAPNVFVYKDQIMTIAERFQR